MATLSAFPGLLRRDREREGQREARAAWLLGVTVRELRELEAGERWPTSETFEQVSNVGRKECLERP